MMRRTALLLLSLVAAARVDAQPPGALQEAAADKPAAAQNEIQALVQQRKYEDALTRLRELRTEAKKPMADAESEYWGARALSAMKQTIPAREAMQKIAAAFPDATRGRDASIEATTILLNSLGEGKAEGPTERKTASDCAKELEATAARLTDPEGISRAWYVSGNAWRIYGDDVAAEKSYGKAAAVAGAADYPAKALYSLSTGALQRFDVAGARQLLSDCMTKYPESSQVDKCGKATARLNLMGTPAPPLEVETWLNGPPQDMSALKGRVVLVWFFASWCPHCKQTMPEIAAMKERFKGKPLTIVGITNNSKDQTTEVAKVFVSDPQWGITYPAAIDRMGATSLAYHGTGIPAAALVDKKGIVRWADHPTYLNDKMVETLLNE